MKEVERPADISIFEVHGYLLRIIVAMLLGVGGVTRARFTDTFHRTHEAAMLVHDILHRTGEDGEE